MIHNPIKSSTDAHWGVSRDALFPSNILLQIQDRDADQARVSLTVEEAIDIAHTLIHHAQDIEKNND